MELEVSPAPETFTNYIIPAFESIEEARKAFKVCVCVCVCVCACACVRVRARRVFYVFCLIPQDEGLTLESEYFLSAEVRSAASSNLAKFYTMSKCSTNTHRCMSAWIGLESTQTPTHLPVPSAGLHEWRT